MNSFPEAEKEAVRNEVIARFNQLVVALNWKDARAWSEFYSEDEFISAVAGTDYYGVRSAWVDAITGYFSTRERQRVEPVRVRVTPIDPNLALMTSEEKSEMSFEGGEEIESRHVFTMIWKNGKGGWKILHSHESWIDEQVK